MKSKIALLFIALLAGCSPSWFFYDRSSGLRVDSNPALFARFSDAKVQCDAYSAEKALTSVERDIFIHNKNVNLIYWGCMAKAGYDVRP